MAHLFEAFAVSWDRPYSRSTVVETWAPGSLTATPGTPLLRNHEGPKIGELLDAWQTSRGLMIAAVVTDETEIRHLRAGNAVSLAVGVPTTDYATPGLGIHQGQRALTEVSLVDEGQYPDAKITEVWVGPVSQVRANRAFFNIPGDWVEKMKKLDADSAIVADLAVSEATAAAVVARMPRHAGVAAAADREARRRVEVLRVADRAPTVRMFDQFTESLPADVRDHARRRWLLVH